MSLQYITTAIDYPNAAPHMGHVLEKVLADVAARWMRLRGDSVRFQIGTDEHGIKIQRTAVKEGVSPQELTDRNVPFFRDLYATLGISADVFVRTTDQKKHWPTVQALWNLLKEKGALEKRSYTGLYCSGCERFVTKKDLIDGLCPDHKIAPEEVTEENWFFLLGREQEWLRKILKDGTYRILPEYRANETLALLDQGLEDVSFSRPVSSLSWGIPVPGEESQVMYVWCDALSNYISGIGLLTDHAEKQWWNDATVTHVIGKDITRFHALIWPAMLRQAGIRTPDQLLVHGFLTSEGQKMSKSLGNVVKPDDVLAHFHGNPDPLRFYLSHEVIVGNDGDFTWEHIDGVYNGLLRNQLGNLLNRVIVLFKKAEAGFSGEFPTPAGLADAVSWSAYTDAMNGFRLDAGIRVAMEAVDRCNKALQIHTPWSKPVEERVPYLVECAEVLRHVALMLLPFIPTAAQSISMQLGVPYAARMSDKNFIITDGMKAWGGDENLRKEWKTVGEPSILFPPLS